MSDTIIYAISYFYSGFLVGRLSKNLFKRNNKQDIKFSSPIQNWNVFSKYTENSNE